MCVCVFYGDTVVMRDYTWVLFWVMEILVVSGLISMPMWFFPVTLGHRLAVFFCRFSSFSVHLYLNMMDFLYIKTNVHYVDISIYSCYIAIVTFTFSIHAVAVQFHLFSLSRVAQILETRCLRYLSLQKTIKT